MLVLRHNVLCLPFPVLNLAQDDFFFFFRAEIFSGAVWIEKRIEELLLCGDTFVVCRRVNRKAIPPVITIISRPAGKSISIGIDPIQRVGILTDTMQKFKIKTINPADAFITEGQRCGTVIPNSFAGSAFVVLYRFFLRGGIPGHDLANKRAAIAFMLRAIVWHSEAGCSGPNIFVKGFPAFAGVGGQCDSTFLSSK